MNDAPQQQPGRPRRTFLEPPKRVPFVKTREGGLIVGLGILLLLCGVVAVRAYLKAQAYIETKRLQDEAAAAAPVVSKDERLAQKRAELPSIYEGAFADSANGDGFLETTGYAKLLELLSSMSPEDTAKRAANTNADYATASAEPDLLRGEFVNVRGLVAGPFAVKLEHPVHEITDVWRGIIAQPNGDEAFVFDFIRQPPPFEEKSTLVEVDGLMYRTVSYESKTHEQRISPYLLARGIRTIEAKSEAGAQTKFWVTIMGIGAIIGYLVLRRTWRAHVKDRRQPTRLKAIFQERLRARREQEL